MLPLRRLACGLLGVVPALFVAIGILSIVPAVQARDPVMYSVHGDDYVGDAFMFSITGTIGLMGCHRLWRTDTRVIWVWGPIATILFALVLPALRHGHHGAPLNRADSSTLQYLRVFAATATHKARERGRFTCESTDEPFNPSMFARQGRKLPYVVQCVTAATGPVTGTPPERPGTILLALSPDGKQAWFAATVLSRRIDRQAIWLTRDEQPLVISEQVRPDF